MSERTADPTFQDYSTLTPDKAEDFTFGGHMYHTTNDGKMFLPNAELPGQDIEIGTNESKTIMAGRNYNAFQDKLDHRDDPVRIDNPVKLEGTTPYTVHEAYSQGGNEYHYVDVLPSRPYTDQQMKDIANTVGKVEGPVSGVIAGVAAGAGLAGFYTNKNPNAIAGGAVVGGLAGGISGYLDGPEAVLKNVNRLKGIGLEPMKAIHQEGNKTFMVRPNLYTTPNSY